MLLDKNSSIVQEIVLQISRHILDNDNDNIGNEDDDNNNNDADYDDEGNEDVDDNKKKNDSYLENSEKFALHSFLFVC